MGRWTSKRTSVQFQDAVGETIDVGPGPGDLTMDNIAYDNAEWIRKLDRGTHDGFVEGDDLIQACAITIELENVALTHATQKRILDWIRKTGSFAAGAANEVTSVSSDTWAWKTVITFTDGVTTSTCTLPECTGSGALAEAKEGSTLAISFSNHQAPTWT
jgi:hypothetical protein